MLLPLTGSGGSLMSSVDIAPDPPLTIMEAFFVSAVAVAIGEIGDKTQLLSLLLAARFRRPVPIIFGILVATLLNHALAAAVGQWVAAHVAPELLRWILGGSFIAIAIWTLKPDQMEEEPLQR